MGAPKQPEITPRGRYSLMRVPGLSFAILFGAGLTACQTGKGQMQLDRFRLDPARFPAIGTVDERFQSFNVEMLEVTGGKFWKPYRSTANHAASESDSGATPAGMNPSLYEYRAPIDLTNPRLRKLAKALAPAYMRVSGTWANTTYFPTAGESAVRPPKGFQAVLTRKQWKGVVDFSLATDARIVTSFSIGAGVRDRHGNWTPAQAQRLLKFTKSTGGRIAAAEFMNEPNLAVMGGAPAAYDAKAYGRDFKLFYKFAKRAAPDMLLLHPGTVGNSVGSWHLSYGVAGVMDTREMLAVSGLGAETNLDAVSYHHYGAVSQRCEAMGNQTTAEEALSEQWLRRTDETLAFYKPLRDQYAPGKPFWNTETADSACGGNPWGGSFLDTFRYLDQMGRLAKQEVAVIIHNTLAASDYSLLEEKTLTPKPIYWAALLWRQLMGTKVLEAGIPIQHGLHAYAHCLRGTPGGVALLILNTDAAAAREVEIPAGGRRYTLSAQELRSAAVALNGQPLSLGAGDDLPAVNGAPIAAGTTAFAPATISFLTFPGAANPACFK